MSLKNGIKTKKRFSKKLVFKVCFPQCPKKKRERNTLEDELKRSGPKFMPHLMAYIVFTRFGVHGYSSPFWCEILTTSLAKNEEKKQKKKAKHKKMLLSGSVPLTSVDSIIIWMFKSGKKTWTTAVTWAEFVAISADNFKNKKRCFFFLCCMYFTNILYVWKAGLEIYFAIAELWVVKVLT